MSLLGTSVRSKRVAAGWSLAELAVRAGCSRSYLSQIENGVNGGLIDATLLGVLERVLGFAQGELALMQVMARMPKAALARLNAEREDEQPAISDEGRSGSEDAGVKARLRREGIDALYKSGELARLVGGTSGIVGTSGGKRGLSKGEVRTRGGVHAQARMGSGGDGAGLVGVPVVERVAAGGATEFGEGELHGPKVAVPRWIEAGAEGPVNGASAAFACVVTGDSMSPTYSEGDLVVFTGAREAREGEDCYVRLAGGLGEATFKRVRFEEGDGGARVVRLIPLNARYEARVFAGEEVEAIYPAVWVIRRAGERGG